MTYEITNRILFQIGDHIYIYIYMGLST